MAYELKELAEKLKAQGLDLAEDALATIVKEAISWAKEEAQKGTSIVVDAIVLAASPVIEPLILKQVDKIDGKVG
jgi:hypothetical protein